MEITGLIESMYSRHGLTHETILQFRREIYDNYKANPRPMPWRQTDDPYRILVSEVMLQQTRVERVVGKYLQFIAAFPDFTALGRAPFPEVLAHWQGLGYNRRALSLHKTAKLVIDTFDGKLPPSPAALQTLPGIGAYTAAAIAAFAFHQPVVLIETNIRSVYIHFFFMDRQDVPDREIFPFIRATLDADHVRTWYYALMDYGARLKQQFTNPSRRSAHYARQAPFHGSDRQVRGKILKLLLEKPFSSRTEIAELTDEDMGRLCKILTQLEEENLIIRKRKGYAIAEN